MGKIHVNISVDPDVYFECRKQSLNVSGVCNGFLKRLLAVENGVFSEDVVDSEILRLQAELSKLESQKADFGKQRVEDEKRFASAVDVKPAEVSK